MHIDAIKPGQKVLIVDDLLATGGTLKASVELVEKLGGSVNMHKVPLRSAGFRVLSAPDVPSVLIELGYMSSPKDAELLNSEGWRTQAAAAVQQAVDQYFERLQSPGKAAQSRP